MPFAGRSKAVPRKFLTTLSDRMTRNDAHVIDGGLVKDFCQSAYSGYQMKRADRCGRSATTGRTTAAEVRPYGPTASKTALTNPWGRLCDAHWQEQAHGIYVTATRALAVSSIRSCIKDWNSSTAA